MRYESSVIKWGLEMAGMISIDKLLFISTLNEMETSAGRLNTNIVPWSSQGEQSKVLSVYARQYQELQSIMLIYKKLIMNDIRAIRSMNDEIVKLDEKLIKIWK